MSSPALSRQEERAVNRSVDLQRLRGDFPILRLKVNGKPLAYLDNGASSQMPQPVMDRLTRYQTQEHSNIHRAVHRAK
jgi:cysteine desulfurase/selenocysteine lyase